MTLPKVSTRTKTRTLSDFIGSWDLRRAITQADGTAASFNGMADWTMSGQNARYSESGQLIVGDAGPVTAQKSYTWHEDLTVWFSDGRFFHAVPPTGGSVVHDCPPDTYAGAYDFANWPSFQVTWRVTGPRKDYRLTSTYTRRRPEK